MKKSDVIVIGNGALGLSTAFALRRLEPDARITVIGPRSRPGGASQAAGAMTGTWGEVTEASVRTDAGQRKHALAVEALGRWPAWLDALNSGLAKADRVEHQPGTFIIRNAIAGPLEDRNFAAIVRSLDAHDEPYEHVAPADVPGLMPNANTRALQALHIPREGAIDSARLLAALERRLVDDPAVSYIDGHAARLLVEGDRCIGVETRDGTRVLGPRVLLAAGARCQALLDGVPELARRIPRLITSVGTAIRVARSPRRIEHVIRTPNRAGGCGLHVVPRAGDRELYIGATSTVHLTPRDHTVASEIHSLVTWAQEQIDMSLGAAAFIGPVTGNRPVAIDAFPLIGALSIEGLYMLSGTFRDGLHMSPVLASEMAASIARGDGPDDSAFRPERPPIPAFASIEDAIASAVEQYMSSVHEHRLVGVKVGFPRRLKLMFERFIRNFYEGIEIDYVPPYEILTPVEMVRTLDARTARTREIGAMYAALIEAHAQG